MKSRPLRWFSLSLLIGLLSIFLYSRRVSAPELGNDSYQYLDSASHLASGACLCTTVAHFDEQVGWGRMPIPFTHFGPAYPLAIAGLKVLGLPVETGGYLLSVAGYLLVICLIWLTSYYLEIEPWSIALVCLVWSVNFLALDLGVSVGTDCLFTALFTGVCALVAYDVRSVARPRPAVLLALGALVGAGFWLRQAGLFLVPPLFLYLAWRWWRQPRSRPYALGGAALALTLVAWIMARNIRLVHSWNSGFANGRHAPWQTVISESARVPYHVLFGTQTKAHLDIWAVLFFTSLLVLAWRALANRRQGPAPARLPHTRRTTVIWMLVFAAAFAGGTLVAELRTIVADYVRYDFPLLPIVLIVCGVLFRFVNDRIARVAALACVLSVVMIDVHSLVAQRQAGMSSLPTDLLAQQVQPGTSMRTWIEQTVPSDATLIATEGQAVHYLLNRPVVAIIEPQYTVHTWDETDLRSVMRRFGAQYILVFPGAGKERAPEQQSVPFLLALSEGHNPGWLSVAARTRGVILYRCSSCSTVPA